MAGGLLVLALLLLLGGSVPYVSSQECAGSTTNIALNRPATQSSTKYQGAAGRAVDGDVSPRYAENSCTHTAKESNPWWQVDLGKSQCVDRVVVTNREDCCSKRLEGFTVHVGDNPDVYKNPTCGGPQSVGGKKLIEVDCGGKTGRYVGITLSGKRRTLTLCEVQVFGGSSAAKAKSAPKVSSAPPDSGSCAVTTANIALNKKTTQSSTRYGGAAGRAVDGDVSPRYAENSCTHTAKESNPWWQVDLGKSQCVDRVVVTNREDCCSERLEGFTVHVGDNPDVFKNPTCGGPQSAGGKKLIEVDCGGKTGRYVGITLKGSMKILTLCEVQVFGGGSVPYVSSQECAGSTTNIALNRPATQSSTRYQGAAGRAVDGDVSPRYAENSCTHTAKESNPWWQVDLGKSQCVDRVVVTNREDCCSERLEGFTVHVGDNPDVYKNPTSLTTTNIALNKKTTQSSTRYGGAAGRAVDGNVSPRYAENSCTHTAKESNPWWQVDLGKSQCVGRVVVTNRKDCCSERLEGFTVHVGDNPDVYKNPTCGGPQSVGGKKLIEVDCGGKTGRYVGITLSGKRRTLTLCEVQVFGGSSAAKGKSAPKVSSAPPDSGSCAVTTANIALNKKTTQSSTRYGGAAGRAVDGDVSPRYAENSCTHTAKESNPWWQVDLGKSQCVDRVVVTNREDCCSERLEGFTVHVGDNPDVFKNPTCGGPQSAGGKKLIEVDCGGKTGRYVGITLKGSMKILTLCEVQVFGGSSAAKAKSAPKVSSAPPDSGSCALTTTNIALNKQATQSSTKYRGAAGRAVDGDVSPRYAENSCTHTAKESNPWWQVDLGKSQCVGRVVVTNREDCCSNRLEGFTVYVGDNPEVYKNPTCGGPQSVGGKKLIEVDCGGKTGRYVGITLSGRRKTLTLCEVQVYGAGGTTNIALNKPAEQSSVRFRGAAGRAVDGNDSPYYKHNTCTHTAKGPNPWWRVDLGKSECVDRVVVTNRKDCCKYRLNGFTVYVGDNPDVTSNPSCGGAQSVVGKDVITVNCGGLTGRYVGIALKGAKKVLTLCEVKVMGGPPPPKKLSQCAASTTNIALNKPAEQSSVRFRGAAGRAVDGNDSPYYKHNTCTHTAKGPNPWWRVDLGKSECVDRVVVTNRKDCCKYRLNGFTVYVGDSPDVTSNPSCGGAQSVRGKDVITVNCGGLTGRYVGIALKGAKKVLTLCEVKVFGGVPTPKVEKAPPKLGQCAASTKNIALNRQAEQSSIAYRGAPGRAVDGDDSPLYRDRSCTHTKTEANPWWRVDLGKSECVHQVVVTNRKDCCSNKLNGFTVYVGDNPDVTSNPSCGGAQSVKGKDVITVNCGGLTGRYVGIALKGRRRVLTLCEVEVIGAGSTTNIALNQQTTQSSTGFKGAPSRAVDGNRNAIYAQKSCSHTAMERNPWWRVDLGSSQCVDRVAVVKRQRCCGQWLEGFQVYVGDNPNVMENPKCGGLQSVKGKDVITVNCDGLTGRYVGIALPGKRQYLILCEVEVYGGSEGKVEKVEDTGTSPALQPPKPEAPPAKITKEPPKLGQCAGGTTNIALNQPAIQSSTGFKGAPSRAVDGNRNAIYAQKSCSHTAMERNPWWRVDLGSSQCVDRVAVVKRQRCCGQWLEGFQVYVGDNPNVMENPKCGGLQSVEGKDVITVNCGGLTGRYVGIALPGKRQYLILCEVEVYGGSEAKVEKVEETGTSLMPQAPKPEAPPAKIAKEPPKLGQCAGGTTNIALNQPAIQSSTGFKGAPSRAVDGNRNAIYAQKSCSHTAMERNPWWRVDLGSSQCVDRVAVVKRQRCCGQWLEGFQVYVGDNPNVMENPKCGGLQSVEGKDVITVNCGGLTGRYVGIALPGKRQYLILCEVEVYGGSEAKVEKVEETGTSLALQAPKPDPCKNAECQNDATCEPDGESFKCICPKGYAGTMCETNVDDCAANPCQNDGTCQDGVDGFTCICPKGFAGNLCETNVDDCAANPCQNEGTCEDGVDGFTCICPKGFAGNLCETNVDDCADNPCQNDGTCQDGVDGFTCICPTGFAGNLCETNIDNCTPNPCQNGGTCNDLVNAFLCSCKDGYGGNLCEIGPLPPPAPPAPKPKVQPAVQPKPAAGVIITIGGGNPGGSSGYAGDGAINVINNQISVYGKKGCGCTTPNCACPVKKETDSSKADDLPKVVQQRLRGSVKQPEDDASNLNELDTVETVYEPVDNEMALSDDETTYEQEAREEQDNFEEQLEDDKTALQEEDTREEQWADDMALSDDDSAFRTADELEMLNNKLRSLRELLELETRGVQTEIEKLLSGFKGVKLTGNGDIPTKPFLDACRRMVPLYDHLGETAFAPVKSDINGNILKLTKKYSTDPDRYSTLQDIVKQEMAEKTTKAKNSATDALLWLRRALEFHQHFLAVIAEVVVVSLGIASTLPISKCPDKKGGTTKWVCNTSNGSRAQQTNKKGPFDHNHHNHNHNHNHREPATRDNKLSLTTERLYSSFKSTEKKRDLKSTTSIYETTKNFTDEPIWPSTITVATVTMVTRPRKQNGDTASVLSIRVVLAFVCGFALSCLLSFIFVCCKRHLGATCRILQGTGNGLVAVLAMANPVYRANTPGTPQADEEQTDDGTSQSAGEQLDDDQAHPSIQPYAETSLSEIQTKNPIYQNED
uniref:Uncharacterized protein n=1 Tax=Branchiostoma floridae TaxID=7739 RepID=C3XSY6_BRAFL|eukprot:XP_002612845.1 hypothetical protein BRAFLDRAFT_118409 [Branchiostoma floridae]